MGLSEGLFQVNFFVESVVVIGEMQTIERLEYEAIR